jgi:hypothetical protein
MVAAGYVARRPGDPELGPGQRWALHHAIVRGDLAFGSWRDGGLTIHDMKDPTQPKLLVHRHVPMA